MTSPTVDSLNEKIRDMGFYSKIGQFLKRELEGAEETEELNKLAKEINDEVSRQYPDCTYVTDLQINKIKTPGTDKIQKFVMLKWTMTPKEYRTIEIPVIIH